MSKQCPPNQILNPATNRCVNRDGVIGKKILRQNITTECPPGKIRNPTSNRCVDINGKIGREVLRNMTIPPPRRPSTPIQIQIVNTPVQAPRQTIIVPSRPSTSRGIWNPFKLKSLRSKPEPLFNKGISKKNCERNIKYKIDQCQCPMCWIASSVIAIKFSNLHKYMAPEYRKFVNDTYDAFSGKAPDITKCPRVPKKIADQYIAIYESKRGPIASANRENLLVANGGYTVEFMISVLRVGLVSPYTAILRESIDTKYANNIVVVNNEILPKAVSLENANLLANVLIAFRKKFYNLGYVFTSGRVKVFKKNENDHSVAFTVCNDKYYICNSFDVPCIEIKNSEMFKEEISSLGAVKEITFLLIPF